MGRWRRVGAAWPLGLIAPLAILATALMVVPLVCVGVVSVTEADTFFFAPKYTGENYSAFFDRYGALFGRSFVNAGLATLAAALVGVPFAYILERRVYQPALRTALRALLVFPLFGGLYIAYGARSLLLSGGALAPVLRALDIEATDILYTRGLVIFGLALYTLPFMVLNVSAALERIDPAYEEAAEVLGAGLARRWRKVILPLLRPGIAIGCVICFSLSLGEFAVPKLVGGPADQKVLSVVVAERALGVQDYGLAAALGMALVAIAFVVTYVMTRLSREQFREARA